MGEKRELTRVDNTALGSQFHSSVSPFSIYLKFIIACGQRKHFQKLQEAILKSSDRRIWNTVNKYRPITRHDDLGAEENWLDLGLEVRRPKGENYQRLGGQGIVFSLAFLFYRRLSSLGELSHYFKVPFGQRISPELTPLISRNLTPLISRV